VTAMEGDAAAVAPGPYPIATSQYSSTTLYRFYDHIQQLFC
jgi:hypothetical protein